MPGRLAATFIASALALPACAHFTTNPPVDPAALPATVEHTEFDEIEGDALIGIAVSGGGSRAARFATAVLEQLWGVQSGDRLLMPEVDHISSVSGGSIASSNYVLHKPAGAIPPGHPFWGELRARLATNLEGRLIGSLLLPNNWSLVFPRWTLTDLMAEKLDNNFYEGATLGDLAARAHDEGAMVPHLLINSVVYRCERKPTELEPESLIWGRKFVFTDLPWELFRESMLVHEQDGSGRSHTNRLFRVWTPREIGSDPNAMRVDRAVMASACFPLVFAPLHLKDHSEHASSDDPHVYLGDGGIYDNSGIETLVQLYGHLLNQPANKRRRAIIIVIDGSAPYQFASDDDVRGAESAFSIMERRAQALGQKVLDGLVPQALAGVGADGTPEPRLRITRIRYIHPRLEQSDHALWKQLGSIGTRLNIEPEHGEALDLAARRIFEEPDAAAAKDGEPSVATQLRQALAWATAADAPSEQGK